MKALTFVTQNSDKLADVSKLLPEFEIQHIDFAVPEIQSLNPREIVEHKLKYAYERAKVSCFVMDASLCMDCLNGFHGPFIKWYFTHTVGAEKTCKIASLFDEFYCTWTTVLGFFDGQETHFLEETVNGKISPEPRGTNGYEWDVIFIPEGDTRTFAEMTFEEKQSYAVTKKLLLRLKALIINQ
ncbi:MAG: non-canonical purine NTP pyrophosphatase [Candidatus Jacksonbacteria bacterium]|nr:non-canonical purine NTP pyrophosphatase [Candidatus Jacksonbacteria bacterium]